MNTQDPHAGVPAVTGGAAPNSTAAAVVLIHGRGGSAGDMLSLFDAIDVPGVAAVALQAAGHTWYPQSFLAPTAANQPHLDSALKRVETAVAGLIASGTPAERIALLGFSQGACLASEFVARHPRRYGAVMALTGGLIGPPGTQRDYAGGLPGVPVFLGCGDPDPHVPFARVEETRDVFERMGAAVDLRRYPGRPHTVSQDEIDACQALLSALIP